MIRDANLFFRIGAGFFGSALIKLGLDSLRSPEVAAKEFGLPAMNRETLAYMPVWGIRDLGFGAAILALLAAESSGLISGGSRPAAIVTAIGSCVGMADSFLVSAAGGQGATGHAIGATGMAAMAFGIWVSS
jgi:hypothetical protein